MKKEAKIRERIAISFMRMFKLGPEVSFKVSPTVSPTTAALCSSVPFIFLLSKNFLALSQAPPELELEIAIYTALTKAPGKIPATALVPNRNPKMMGVPITKSPGPTISLREAVVEILIQAL